MRGLLIVSIIGGVLLIAGFGFAAGMAWALTLQDGMDAATVIFPGSARRLGRRRKTMGIKLSEYQRPGKPAKTSGQLRAEERLPVKVRGIPGNAVLPLAGAARPTGEKEHLLMEKQVTDQIMRQALRKYGILEQTLQAIQELSELIRALAGGKCNKEQKQQEHIAEEIADVEIMLAQIKLYYPKMARNVEDAKDAKLRRLAEKMGMEIIELAACDPACDSTIVVE